MGRQLSLPVWPWKFNMAIAFNCPHCLEAYRLKDEFGGKQAKCKNPECRQLITIPRAITIEDEPKLTAEEAEAAALAALNEDAPAAEQQAAPAEKTIPITCKYCDHKWTEPVSKAGKNVLCPNPECRQRMRVPEPKEEKTDWRQQQTKIPEAVRQNQPKLEDVQDATEVKFVSGQALREADATGVEYEPRPLKQKIIIGLTAFGLVAGVAFGGWYFLNRRTAVNEEQLMADAQTEFASTRKEWASLPDRKDPKAEWAATQGGLYSAVLNLAAAEYALGFHTAEKTKEAHDLYGKAINDLRSSSGPERDALVAELVFAVLAFGGTDEEAKDEIRYAWMPNTTTGNLPRISGQSRTIHGELQTTLRMLTSASLEFRFSVARRLTRELTRRGHATMAADLIPQALFADADRNEARAVIALEIHRIDSASPQPRVIADDLKRLTGTGLPPSSHALFAATKVEKAPPPPTLPTSGLGSDARFAHTAGFLIEGKNEEALALARRPGSADHQIRSLVLCAEWMPDPGPALEAAQALAAKMPRPSITTSFHLLRLSQIAAEKGRHDLAKTLAEAITDPGLKAWAIGDAARFRTRANPEAKAEEAWVELPESPRDLKAGHAWGRLWIARHNAKLSRERDAEKAATASWPQPIHPFALAGIALGLQEQ